MQLRRLLAVVLLVPTTLASQPSAAQGSPREVMFAFENFADHFGGQLVAAFDSIPASRYDYRPTPTQQTIGYIAQHLEEANYVLCGRFTDLKPPRTRRDSLPDTVKARWPKDSLVKRLDASLRFCDKVLEHVGQLDSPALVNALLAFETDLAEHYSQISVYMRLLGMVPPSALPPRERVPIELPASELSPLVGVYQVEGGPQVYLTMSDGLLFIQSSGGGLRVRLWPESHADFFVKERSVADLEITVTRGPEGAVTGLVIHQNGRDRLAKKTS
jgi:Domain of unknown function (DUF3471)/DinB superfamily